MPMPMPMPPIKDIAGIIETGIDMSKVHKTNRQKLGITTLQKRTPKISNMTWNALLGLYQKMRRGEVSELEFLDGAGKVYPYIYPKLQAIDIRQTLGIEDRAAKLFDALASIRLGQEPGDGAGETLQLEPAINVDFTEIIEEDSDYLEVDSYEDAR